MQLIFGISKLETDYVLFASSSDQISQKVVEEAKKTFSNLVLVDSGRKSSIFRK